ncbi:hypothetical protein PF005_g8106 [Phytophthora fragariae]|nr:hypothetical protein PF003_g6464 [Phytophthora fragariae]KAE9018119.1 hypothetical protein PF011_g6400 [Phytophthora fragariae]KAE9112282.1 hypothetical protein PF010_g10504 [Phytophthora fragariae]KAE9126416.1 hypothetical protein PF007_g5990 [Phytophthora fragariae]KAE9149050.1 hypothetical protein PF006_g6434 [Phytophthora fragariae]
MMARSDAEIALMTTFQERYDDDLAKALSGELSGGLEEVIMTAMRDGLSEFKASIHTSVKTAADADALSKAGDGRMGRRFLTEAGAASMSGMYAHYARESSSIESMPFSSDIDEATREIERARLRTRLPGIAAVEDCAAAPPNLVALPHRVRAETDGVCEEYE